MECFYQMDFFVVVVVVVSLKKFYKNNPPLFDRIFDAEIPESPQFREWFFISYHEFRFYQDLDIIRGKEPWKSILFILQFSHSDFFSLSFGLGILFAHATKEALQVFVVVVVIRLSVGVCFLSFQNGKMLSFFVNRDTVDAHE